jgi:phosphopantothenoylcysteine decarboxylase/phosphopantothenate--cysteine ligase
VLLMAAAPADFRAAESAPGKLRRREGLELRLEPTEDILAGLSAARTAEQTVIGFAAEHGGDAIAGARQKLARKGTDLIVLNDVSDPSIGFESGENEVTLVDPETETAVPRAPKDAIADAILDRVDELRRNAGLSVSPR